MTSSTVLWMRLERPGVGCAGRWSLRVGLQSGLEVVAGFRPARIRRRASPHPCFSRGAKPGDMAAEGFDINGHMPIMLLRRWMRGAKAPL